MNIKFLIMAMMLLLVPIWMIFSSPFSLKKQKKEEKISEDKKQKYAQTCGEIIQTFPHILHALADTHAHATQAVQAFVENDASLCSKISKDQFEQCCKKAEQVAQQLKQIQKELQG